MSFADNIWAVFSRKSLIILAGIILLYSLWLYGLSTNPPGFYVDEACLAYSGYLIATTGAIEDGTRFPLYVHCYTQGWSQNASPAQPYALAVLYSFISPSVISARIYAATIVFLAILLLGFLAARISGQTSVGVIVALTGMVTPWLFEYSRLVMETFVLIFSYVLFLFFLYNAYKREKWKLADNFLIALSLTLITYCYAAGRFVAPLFAFGLLIFAVNKRALWDVFKTWIIYAITMIPLLVVYYKTPLVITARFLRATHLSRDKSIWENAWTAANALYQDTSLHFFIFSGDHLPRHHIPNSGMGEILVGTFALGILGILIILIRHRSSNWWRFILFGSVVSLLPGAFSTERNHSMRGLSFAIFFLVMTVPAISWLLGLYKDQPAELEASKEESGTMDRSVRGGSGFFRFPATERYLRLGLLVGLLIMTAVQAVQFQIRFHEFGVNQTRKGVFHESYPRVFEKAIEDGSRPIYLMDVGEPVYIFGYWYGAIAGLDRSNFVHLLDRQNPPEGALVITSKGSCTDCQVVYLDGGFLVYRNLKPDTSQVAAPVPASPALAPSVFTAGPGSGPGQLVRPKGIAVDGNGNIYVADGGNGRIQKFDSEGRFVIEFGNNGPAEVLLKSPSGVAVDEAGMIWVVDGVAHKLTKFNPDGTFADSYDGPDTGFYGPRDITFGPNKQLYIVDQGRSRIAGFEPQTETYSRIWGTPGSDPSQLKEPTGVAVGNDLVFVADLGNGRVQVFDLWGKFVRLWDVPSWAKTSDEYPSLVFDEQTKILYVTSSKANEVLAFDIMGNQLQGFNPKDEENMLGHPSSMAIAEINKKRWLYVVNTGNSKVSKFELESPKKIKQ